MSIKLVTGVPGSGKSYYAVNHLVTKHFKWNKDLDCYDNVGKVVIITDIDGLRLEHYSLDDLLQKYSVTFEEFFTVPFQEKLSLEFPDHHIVYLLDEIQRRLPAGYRNTDVLFYFQWHRHLGHDVYLMAQTSESVCKHIVALIEFEIMAVRESVKVGKVFKYHFMAGDLKVDEKTLNHDKKIFGLYTSFKKDDQGDKPRPLRKIIIRTGVAIMLMLLLGYWSYRGIRRTIRGVDAGSKPQIAQTQLGGKLRGMAQQDGPESRGARTVSGRKADVRPETSTMPGDLVADPAEGKLHLVRCGGLWVGPRLVAVQLWGKLIRLEDMAYPVTDSGPGNPVNVLIPAAVLSHVQSVVPAGRAELYRGMDDQLHVVGESGGDPSSDDSEDKSSTVIPAPKFPSTAMR